MICRAYHVRNVSTSVKHALALQQIALVANHTEVIMGLSEIVPVSQVTWKIMLPFNVILYVLGVDTKMMAQILVKVKFTIYFQVAITHVKTAPLYFSAPCAMLLF